MTTTESIEVPFWRDLLSDGTKKFEDKWTLGGEIFNTYIWVLGAVGIPANTIIIITIARMRVVSPATCFISLLAVCDGMALVTKLIGHILFRWVYQGTALCKLGFSPMYFSTLANWALVMIAFERFIAVCYPLKKVYLLTKRRCLIAVVAVSIVLLLPFVVVFSLTQKTVDGICYNKKEHRDFFVDIWHWIDGTLYLFIPFLATTAFTIAIIRSLATSRKHRRSMMRKASGSLNTTSTADERLLKSTEKTERMITVMLVVASVMFRCVCVPSCINPK